mmetsp:Transcript_19914/g.41764  ORF Transcript_19914/g.41764 Transcript_19914/m.41764 type:complete len:240 (+) Transcript_19914:992-1711(+)
MCLLRQANKERHGHILTHLENAYTLGEDCFPRTEAYNLLLHLKNPNEGGRGQYRGQYAEGMTFANQEQDNNEDGDGGEGEPWHAEVKCYYCQKKGHIAKDCPKKKKNKPAETHATHTNIGGAGSEGASVGPTPQQLSSPPANVVADQASVMSETTESRAPSLPGSIPQNLKYDPITGRVFVTVLVEEEEDDEFAFHLCGQEKPRGKALPSGWLLLYSESTWCFGTRICSLGYIHQRGQR